MPQQSTPFNPDGNASIGTSSSPILSANPYRRGLTLTNDSDTVIYVSASTTAVVGSGYRINPNGGVVSPDNHFDPVSGIHNNKDALGNATTGATKNLCVVEN